MIGFPQTVADTPAQTCRSPVLARRGMVAAAHPLVVAAGLDVLQRGGNAVDAGVAAALTAAVVMPEMCGLGGDLFAVLTVRGHAPVAVLGSGNAPRGASLEDMRAAGRRAAGPNAVPAEHLRMPLFGPLSIGVPGMVDAYGAMLDRFGSMPLSALMQAAIGHAENGFPLTPMGAGFIASSADVLAQHPSSAAIFLQGGRAPRPGTLLRQADLARTLRQIASDGPDVFYRGDLAARIAGFVAANGGALAREDLVAHHTVIEPPLQTTYRGHTVYQTGLPSQGLVHLEALNIAAHADGLAGSEAPAIHVLAEAIKLAFADRLQHAVDPAFGRTPMATLLSQAWAAERYAGIDPARAAETITGGTLHDGDTTYLCVADAEGTMVSLIQSVSHAFGSGMVAGDTGVVLNNRVGRGFSLEDGHPNIYAPGKKTMHTLNCYLVADASGQPVLAGGTPGGDGQPQWNLQTLVALIDGALDVQAAIEVPRWTVRPGTDPITLPSPFTLDVEARVGPDTLAALERLGHRVGRIGPWSAGGACQLIARDPSTGLLVGGSDPRAEGLALGF